MLCSKRPLGLPRWSSGKESTCQCRRPKRNRFNPWVGKIPWRRKWQPTPVFLPGKSHPLSMGSQRVITTEYKHTPQIPGTGRFQSQPCATTVCHTRAWPVAWSSLNFPAQEQLLKLLLSCSSCIVPRISLPANHTLGILLIGL